MSLNYRALVQFDAGRSLFVASAPELGLAGHGPTRAEALAQLEDALAAKVAELRDQGVALPEPVDDEPLPAVSDDAADGGEGGAGADAGAAADAGVLTVRVTPSLRRNLLVEARAEGASLDQLAGELLAEGLALRALGGRRGDRRAAGGEPRRDPGREPDGNEGDRGRGPRGGPGSGPGRARYQAIMEDKATFLEYVRGLESGARGGGGVGPGARSGPPRRDRGRGPGSGGQRGGGGGTD